MTATDPAVQPSLTHFFNVRFNSVLCDWLDLQLFSSLNTGMHGGWGLWWPEILPVWDWEFQVPPLHTDRHGGDSVSVFFCDYLFSESCSCQYFHFTMDQMLQIALISLVSGYLNSSDKLSVHTVRRLPSSERPTVKVSVWLVKNSEAFSCQRAT